MGTFYRSFWRLYTNLPNGNYGVHLAGSGMKVDNFTQLGSSAPAKKMIKFTGTTAALADPNQYTQITHGLTASKILRVDVVVDLGGAGNVQQDYTQSAGYQVGVSFENTFIYVWNSPSNSENIKRKPFKVLVPYDQ